MMLGEPSTLTGLPVRSSETHRWSDRIDDVKAGVIFQNHPVMFSVGMFYTELSAEQ